MNGFKTKDVLTGVVIILIIISALFVYLKFKKDKTPKINDLPQSSTEKILERFKIVDSSNKVELRNVLGENGAGVILNSTLLTDLSDPEDNKFYQVWYQNGENYVSLGKMTLTKSGYLFENVPQNKKIVVSLEKNFDNKLETKILE